MCDCFEILWIRSSLLLFSPPPFSHALHFGRWPEEFRNICDESYENSWNRPLVCARSAHRLHRLERIGISYIPDDAYINFDDRRPTSHLHFRFDPPVVGKRRWEVRWKATKILLSDFTSAHIFHCFDRKRQDYVTVQNFTKNCDSQTKIDKASIKANFESEKLCFPHGNENNVRNRKK